MVVCGSSEKWVNGKPVCRYHAHLGEQRDLLLVFRQVSLVEEVAEVPLADVDRRVVCLLGGLHEAAVRTVTYESHGS